MRKIVLYGAILFQLLLITSLVRGIQLAIKAKTRVVDLEAKKAELLKQQDKLNDQLSYVQSDYYVEKVARDELQLVKPGETVVIVPDAQQIHPSSPTPEEQGSESPNYLKWWDVIRGKSI